MHRDVPGLEHSQSTEVATFNFILFFNWEIFSVLDSIEQDISTLSRYGEGEGHIWWIVKRKNTLKYIYF